MAKAYFIGGAARVGKTTLTHSVLSRRPILAASTDAIRYTLRQVLPREEYPDLFHEGKLISDTPEKNEALLHRPHEILEIQNRESRIVWKSVRDFVKSNMLDGFDVLIEGIAILPEFLNDLDCDFRAVFIGNTSHNHYERMLEHARNNPNDWMHGISDKGILASAHYQRHFSTFIMQEAEKYRLPYVEINDATFLDSLLQAQNELLGT